MSSQSSAVMELESMTQQNSALVEENASAGESMSQQSPHKELFMTGNDCKNSHGGKLTIAFACAASVFFIPLFITRGAGPFDFWWWMSSALLLLIIAGSVFDGVYMRCILEDITGHPARKIGLGLAAALALYMVFGIGNLVSRHIFDFAGKNIDAVYGFRGGASPLRIALLMAIVIGPGEELFWRAFLQRRLAGQYGAWTGFAAAAALYTAVHLASGNLMLVLAAMVCGTFWGLLYLYFESPLINMVSHTVWDLAVFIFFPFTP